MRILSTSLVLLAGTSSATAFEGIPHNHSGFASDLGGGLWSCPVPMDPDQDGDLDLIVTCPDTPFNGTYFFANQKP